MIALLLVIVGAGYFVFTNSGNRSNAFGLGQVFQGSALPQCKIVWFASNSPVLSGGTATLLWSTSNCVNVSINQGIGSVTPSTNGYYTVPVINATTTYTLTAVGVNTVSAQTVVTVLPTSQKVFLLGGHSDNNGWVNDVWSSLNMTNWTLVSPNGNSASKWSQRQSFKSLYFNNKIWVLGGEGVGTNGGSKNDIWSSPDGVTWTQELANAPWGPRFSHSAIVFNNKMWVIAGNNGLNNDYSDVWSSPDGINWTLVQANALFGPRSEHTTVILGNKMGVIGGTRNNNTPALNDVWYSTNGITWTQATASAAWSGRYGHSSLVFQNKVWNTGDSAGNTSDVWTTSNGSLWSLVLGTAPWSNPTQRVWHESLVFNNKIWVLGGHTNVEKNDIWSSVNGSSWNQVVATAPWSARTHFEVVTAPLPQIALTLGSTSAAVTSGSGANDDLGGFTIKFKIKAIGNSVYVSSLAAASLTTANTGFSSGVERSGTATIGGVSTTIINSTDDNMTSVGNYLIEDGDEETFEMTTSVQLPTVGAAGQYRALLRGLDWDTDDDATPDNTYTSNLSTFITNYISLN